MAMETTGEFVCIECLHPAPSLYTSYSADVIRITECDKCGCAVDKYVEYDLVLILIDLVLQYRPAYRHILFNSKFKSFKRVIFIFLLCDAYRAWIERGDTVHQGTDHEHPDPQRVFDLEWRFYIALLRSAVEFGTYAFALLAFVKMFGQLNRRLAKFPDYSKSLTFFLESTLVGFYGSLFVVFSIIWQLHGQLTYRFLTQLFIFLSHLQIQRALFPDLGLLRNTLAVSFAILVQFISGLALQRLLNLLGIDLPPI